MFSKKLLLALLVTLLLLSLMSVSGVDSSNWSSVKVNDVDFKIPPQYQGGSNQKGDSYVLGDLNNFGILCIDEYIVNNYGMWANDNGKNVTIGNHDVVYFSEYNSYSKSNVSHAYFSSGKSVYSIAWNGSDMNENIEEIIINAPPSDYNSTTFHEILDEAKKQYDYKQQQDYNSYYYDTPIKEDYRDNSNYWMYNYFFYKMGQHSKR